ncbi:hypothetical protein MYAM1_000921 [Malassezia yamatoensis]|uniref:Acyltransferase MbtK/IucB-like conserved domain-containing protein n=1 Tax=Malassezia yamatoensis TaxID=253288 RepID=A0AAJ5YV47_9BASI|nr:hypothetical protein MYAM1_000921 [Malassezia yamatoensis]
MSGWLQSKGVWPTTLRQGTFQTVIGQNVKLDIVVHHDSNAKQSDHGPLHSIAIRAVPLLTEKVEVDVTPPAKPFTDSSQEPDDNSLEARCKRFAQVKQTASQQLSVVHVYVLVIAVFTLWPGEEYFVVHMQRKDQADLISFLLYSQLASHLPSTTETDTGNETQPLLVSRAKFWEGAGPMLAGGWIPTLFTDDNARDLVKMSSSISHTQLLQLSTSVPRLSLESVQAINGPIYSRYIPELRQTLTFRCARSTSNADVDLVHRWHASDRVNKGWRQDMSREKHREYLAAQEKSSGCVALIGQWDNEPFGYLEIYNVRESNLFDYYSVDEYDRGFHALVGEEKFRGPHRVRSWMGGIIHLLFLLDPRTKLVVSEPRASNAKMVGYECMCGGHVEKLIDFPHKRAALVHIPRERFFQLCPIGPLPSTQ